MNSWSLSHPRRSLLWLAVVLGGVFLLAVVFARMALADSHARLSELSLSGVTLNPDFDPNISDYKATVPAGVSSTTVDGDGNGLRCHGRITAPEADADDTVAGYQVDLLAGTETTITVTVTQGSSETDYTVVVTRIAANDATLTKLLLSDVMLPALDADMRTYAASVLNDLDDKMDGVQSQTTVTATPVLGASVRHITPDDADGDVDGHQVRPGGGRHVHHRVGCCRRTGTRPRSTPSPSPATANDATLKALSLSGVTLNEPDQRRDDLHGQRAVCARADHSHGDADA